jgi:hypothetical protein
LNDETYSAGVLDSQLFTEEQKGVMYKAMQDAYPELKNKVRN